MSELDRVMDPKENIAVTFFKFFNNCHIHSVICMEK